MDRVYSVIHKPTGSFLLMSADELVARIGVELCYVDLLIEQDDSFENGDFIVRF